MNSIFIKVIQFCVICVLLLVVIESAHAQTYTYDLGGRVTQVVYSNGKKVNYGYDAAGNIYEVSIAAVAPDTTRPVLKFVNPKSGSIATNSSITVFGTASDNDKVSSVVVQLNTEGWKAPFSSNNFGSWQASVVLKPGTNNVSAYAVDKSGNVSLTNTIRCIYEPPKANALISSLATVNLNLQNSTVPQAKSLSSPVISGGASSNSQTYQGLFSDSNGVAQDSSGFFNAVVTSKGTFTAKLQQGNNTYSYSGQFGMDGLVSYSIPREGLSPVSVKLSLQDNDVLTGEISTPDWTAQLSANRAIYSKNNPSPQSGRIYTMILFPPGGEDAAVHPAGYGFGTVNVDLAGNVAFAGTLGESTPIISAAMLSKQGQWPFYASYAGNGTLFGWLSFTNCPLTDISGELIWIKAAQPTAKLYRNAFTNKTEVAGSVFSFADGIRVLNLTGGVMSLNNGGLSQELRSPFTLDTNNAVTGANNLNLKITTTSGLFQGAVFDPATKKTISISGAFLQKENAGYGLFSGTNQSGSVFVGSE